MAVVVEHDKRRKKILDKSLDLFIEVGYEDVTFQKIADRCGITRTTLYLYFKNKREIFMCSIKQLTTKLEDVLVTIAKKDLSCQERLKQVLFGILECCMNNKKLFNVVLLYLCLFVLAKLSQILSLGRSASSLFICLEVYTDGTTLLSLVIVSILTSSPFCNLFQ